MKRPATCGTPARCQRQPEDGDDRPTVGKQHGVAPLRYEGFLLPLPCRAPGPLRHFALAGDKVMSQSDGSPAAVQSEQGDKDMALKKSRTTEWRQRRATQTITTSLTDNDGLPMHGRVDGKVTTEERAEYRERRLRHLQRHPDYDAGWGRPTAETVKAVWELLADSLEVELADVHPNRLTAQQLLVVALDLAVCAGRYAPPHHLRPDEDLSRRQLRRAVTKTRLFDALARRWSDNYRQAREAGRAFQVGDMREDTVRWCRRDLLLNYINFDVLWDVITGHWSKKGGRNPLFWSNRARKQKGRKNTGWGGYNVLLRLHSRSLKKFERLVQADTQYHRLDGVLRVWIDGQARPPAGPHTDIAADPHRHGNRRGQAIHVLPSPFLNAHRRLLVNLAARYHLPAMYEFREYVQDGGLVSYGVSLPDMYRRAASYVDHILKGAKPGDLPIERPTKFELVINAKTAKALGLTIPQSLLLRADQVIE